MTRPTHQRPKGTATSPATEASVINAIRNSEGGMTLAQLTTRLSLPRALLRTTLASIVLSGRLTGTGPANNVRYRLPAQIAAVRTITTANDGGPYMGEELRPAPGIPAGRFAAYALPSRIGDRLHYPGGKVTRLCGGPV